MKKNNRDIQGTGSTPPRILIVEDESIIAMDLEHTLKNLGYTVCSIAPSAMEAVRLAESLQPDLILMDIQLSGEPDGIEAVRLIRQITDIPAIYLTAHADEATFLRAIKTGPYGYLLKPVRKNDLYTTIETALNRRTLERRLSERENHYRCLVETLPQAVVEHDMTGRITFCNTSFSILTGYDGGELVGRYLASLISLSDKRDEGRQLTLFPDNPPPCYTARASLVRRDGSICQVQVDGNRPIETAGSAFLTVVTDTTVPENPAFNVKIKGHGKGTRKNPHNNHWDGLIS